MADVLDFIDPKEHASAAYIPNKVLWEDGSVHTLTGELIEGPDKHRAQLFKSMPYIVNKTLEKDGTVGTLPLQ